MNEFQKFMTEYTTKAKDWWFERHDEKWISRQIESGVNLTPQQIWKNPIKAKFEQLKAMVDKACGRGSTYVLIGCVAVLLFIMLTGGHGILAVVGVAIATVFGAFLAIQRFPWLAKLVTNNYKIVDLGLFAFMFIAANTIFGLQVAAITGILVSIALIVWKTYQDYCKFEDETQNHNVVATILDTMSGNMQVIKTSIKTV